VSNSTFTPNAETAGNLFQQMLASFQTALSAGTKLQEESLKCYGNLCGNFSSPAQWQSGAQGMVQDVVRTTQQNLDDSVRLMQDCSQRMAGFWQKTLEKQQSQAAAAGDNTQTPWELALSAIRTNTEAMLQANAHMLEAWSQLVKETTERMQSFQEGLRNAAESTRHTIEETQRQAAEQAQQAMRAAQQMAASQMHEAVHN
jgi:hypothetical protein